MSTDHQEAEILFMNFFFLNILRETVLKIHNFMSCVSTVINVVCHNDT